MLKSTLFPSNNDKNKRIEEFGKANLVNSKITANFDFNNLSAKQKGIVIKKLQSKEKANKKIHPCSFKIDVYISE